MVGVMTTSEEQPTNQEQHSEHEEQAGQEPESPGGNGSGVSVQL